MSDLDSNSGSIDEKTTNAAKWPVPRIKLLIKLRLEMESQFKSSKSKHLLWTQIYSKMKSYDPTISIPLKEVQKKYSNLVLSYKRIKRSQHQSTKWEFFEDFDESMDQYVSDNEESYNEPMQVLKRKRSPSGDSVSFSSEDEIRPVSESAYVDLHDDVQEVDEVDSPDDRFTSQRIVNDRTPETKKRRFDEIDQLTSPTRVEEPVKDSSDSWFKEYVKLSERREQIRHDNIMEMERKKLEVEKQKLYLMRELVGVVQKLVNK